TARMTDVRSGCGLQVLGNRTSELRNPIRRTVRVFVYRLVGTGAREAEIGRDVDEARPGARTLGGRQQGIYQRRGRTVRGSAEHRRRRLIRNQCGDLGLRLEYGAAEHARQMREVFAGELARRAVGHDAGELEMRVAGDQAQEFTGHIARAAQDDGYVSGELLRLIA